MVCNCFFSASVFLLWIMKTVCDKHTSYSVNDQARRAVRPLSSEARVSPPSSSPWRSALCFSDNLEPLGCFTPPPFTQSLKARTTSIQAVRAVLWALRRCQSRRLHSVQNHSERVKYTHTELDMAIQSKKNCLEKTRLEKWIRISPVSEEGAFNCNTTHHLAEALSFEQREGGFYQIWPLTES